MKEDPSGAAHLIKHVYIVGQQVDYLACGGLPHGWATQEKWLKWEKDTENRIPTVIQSQSENIAKWSVFSWGFVWCQDEQDDAWQQGFGDPCSSLDDSMWQQPCLQGAKVGAGDRSKTLHTISQWTRTCPKDNWMYV